MKLDQAARFALRDATAAWHERVDAVFSAPDLATRAGYGRFLRAQAAAHLPVEAALDAGGAAALMPDWTQRRRADAIRTDLAALGLGVPDPEPVPALSGTPALMGAAYVLEGSRLGGAMLARQVPPDFPRAFLSGGGSAPWRALIEMLDARLRTEQDMAVAIDAACAIFALFEKSGRRLLEGDPLDA